MPETNPGGSDSAFPTDFFQRPVTALFASTSPALLGLVMFGVASAVDPGVTWTDVRPPGEKPHPLDPGFLGLVRPNRYRTVDPESMRPNERATVVKTAELIDSGEPSPLVDQIKTFLGLPAPTQEILAETVAGSRPPVLVLNNAQRIVGFYPLHLTVRFLETFKRLGVSMFLGLSGTVPEGRFAFDYVFRVEGEDLKNWATATLTCEKGAVLGPLSGGRASPLAELGPVARAFEKAHRRVLE